MDTGPYSFIERPGRDAMSADDQLRADLEPALQRLPRRRAVLLIHDGTGPKLASHRGGMGLGLIGTRADSEGSLRLRL